MVNITTLENIKKEEDGENKGSRGPNEQFQHHKHTGICALLEIISFLPGSSKLFPIKTNFTQF